MIVALNVQNLIVCLIEQNTNVYVVIKIAQKSLTKSLKTDFLIRLFQQRYQLVYCLVTEICLPVWIHGWLLKIRRNIKEREILLLIKEEIHFWCRLHACKNCFQRF